MNHNDCPPLTDAERTARKRRRRIESAVVIPAGSLEVSAEQCEALVEDGLLDGVGAQNGPAIAGAVSRLLDWWMKRRDPD